MKTSTILMNGKLSGDTVLKKLFNGHAPHIFPGFASEPEGTQKSYPYIRYISIPAVDTHSMYIRRDVVQYWAGDTDIDNLTKIIERLIFLLDWEQSNMTAMPLPDASGTIKVMDHVVLGTSQLAQPNQDLGVWEQSVSVGIVYTFVDRTKIWDTTETYSLVYGAESLII